MRVPIYAQASQPRSLAFPLSRGPKTDETWLLCRSAMDSAKKGLYEKALNIADQAISLGQHLDDCWSVRAKILRRMGRYDDALQAINRACKYDSSKSSHCRERNNILRAISFASAPDLQMHPNQRAKLEMAKSLVTQGALVSAKNLLEDALEKALMRPTEAKYTRNLYRELLGVLISLGRGDLAEQLVEEARFSGISQREINLLATNFSLNR